jgi:hypothetical protein
MAATADIVDSREVLLAPSRRVKPVKNVLERFGLLDKSFKIVKTADQNEVHEGDAGGVSPPQTVHVLMDLAADTVNGNYVSSPKVKRPCSLSLFSFFTPLLHIIMQALVEGGSAHQLRRSSSAVFAPAT